MKNDVSKIAMYVAIGVLLTVIAFQLFRRRKTERYEDDETENELAALLEELKDEPAVESEDGEEKEPAPMGEDSDDEM